MSEINKRVIKFRAWDKRLKEMDPTFGFGDITHWGQLFARSTDLERLEDYEIMQFTGLTDKNGVEIYEGDIVNINNPANTGEIYGKHTIIFHEGCFMIDRRYSYAHVPLITYALISEVIGNIYEGDSTEILEKFIDLIDDEVEEHINLRKS